MLIREMEIIFRWGYSRGGAGGIPQSCGNNSGALFRTIAFPVCLSAERDTACIAWNKHLILLFRRRRNEIIREWDRAYPRKINRLLYAVFARSRRLPQGISLGRMCTVRDRVRCRMRMQMRGCEPSRASESVRFARHFRQWKFEWNRSSPNRMPLDPWIHATTNPLFPSFVIRVRSIAFQSFAKSGSGA